MHYVGNYIDIIPNGLIDYLLSNKGQPRPNNIPKHSLDEYETYNHGVNAGYDLTATYWHIFESQDIPMQITPPWCTGKIHWWITKMMPGDIMPMHEDPPTLKNNCKRYWMPLQDYEAGHVFIIKDELITNYRAGDVFVYDIAQDNHGAANIGFTPRFVLQVTEFV